MLGWRLYLLDRRLNGAGTLDSGPAAALRPQHYLSVLSSSVYVDWREFLPPPIRSRHGDVSLRVPDSNSYGHCLI